MNRPRPLIALATVIIFFFVGLSPVAAAAPKVGGACTKVGISKKVGANTLVCTKSGKRLLWRVKVVAPVKPPVVLPQPIDWENHNSKEEIIVAATSSFAEWAKTIRSPNVEMNIELDPGTPDQLREWLPASAKYLAVRLPEFTPKHKTLFAGPMTNDSYLAFLNKYYDPKAIEIVKDEYNKMIRSGAGGWTDYFVLLLNLPRYIARNLVETNPQGMKSVAAHEYFHIFQFNMGGCEYWCSGTPKETPFWNIEGGATFVQWQIFQAMGYGSYEFGRNKQAASYVVDQKTPRLPLSEVILTDYSQDPYAIGLAGTEFLVAKIGMDKWLAILMGIDKAGSFAESFKTQAGISLEQFYTYFEAARAGLGFARAS